VKRILLLLLITLVTTPSSGEDFHRLYRGIDIVWDITPADLHNNWKSNINVCWFGKGRGYEIYSDNKGRTNALWHFTFYAFANPGPAAINEPFFVIDKSSGTFTLHLIIPSMSPDEADKFIKSHKIPYYLLIVGQPMYIKRYKNTPSVLIESDRWVVSDYFKVRFIKSEP
jgi:hypothetical protein